MGLTRLDIPHVAYKRSLSTNLTNVVKAKYGFKNGNFGTPGRSKNKYNNVRNKILTCTVLVKNCV